jgi:hypothetical protein
MGSDDVYVYLVFLTDHNDNSNSVEGVFANRDAALRWVLNNGALAADIYGISELLKIADDWWDVIKRREGVYVKTGQTVSIYARRLQS